MLQARFPQVRGVYIRIGYYDRVIPEVMVCPKFRISDQVMMRNKNKIAIYPIKKKMKRTTLTCKEDRNQSRGKKKAPEPIGEIHFLSE